ncbi:FxsA family protein [Bartonella doshiae]|uniref:Phage T7 F exclusion suppressor FxsA n=2 Tax=Bartonella doshiae TaxID=33044 RepID=A0A380ZGY4_BARDO|nr:FxsA family protein [Bartonella doshiae]EJF79745.1 hypothetical protein MCS_01472 [Bartonella doshiae NCTC 12862 = ATCC 700133]MBB6159722.1 UPF0716 protein FxsA [Bartonella doshiae]SUV46228.1 phage T7 F exclusion suppressor FxsA [Bartonella doshiae]
MIKSYLIKPRLFIVTSLSVLLIEIAGFIFVGEEIGILATLILVILTTCAGSILLRIQGISILKNIQRELIQGRTVESDIINDGLIIIGAILLILPGFVSDILGILLIIKPIRSIIWHFFSSFRNKINTHTKNNTNSTYQSEKIIDLNAEDYKIYNTKESPWRKNDDSP